MFWEESQAFVALIAGALVVAGLVDGRSRRALNTLTLTVLGVLLIIVVVMAFDWWLMALDDKLHRRYHCQRLALGAKLA